jgi:hypothetical protein
VRLGSSKREQKRPTDRPTGKFGSGEESRKAE